MVAFRHCLLLTPFLISGAYSTAVNHGCDALKNGHSAELFARNSDVYDYEQTEFWSNTEKLDPSCVFRPQSSKSLADGIVQLVDAQAKFAVRGGGHMGVKGANNIDDGVLIVMSNLTELSLSSDKTVVSVGPSHRWVDVFDYLQKYDLAAPGGRLAPVGVPGLLLAGGVNYHGNQVGWAANSVVNYEIVLANGTLTNVNKTSSPDLFWALKGGSSNFGLVTRFDIETVKSPKIWGGSVTVAEDEIDNLLKASAEFAANISDPKTHIVPAIIPGINGKSDSATVILFYDSDTESYPESLQMFTNLTSTSSTVDFKTVKQLATENAVTVIPDINDIFVAGTVKGTTYDELYKGISIINKTFTEALPELYAKVPEKNITMVELNYQPIGSLWMKASAERGGNPLGLDESQVYLCYAEVVMWNGEEYDDAVNSWVEQTTYKINNATQKAGIYDPFNYMGDSAGFQNIFSGFGSDNHKKLQDISKKYDPNGVFQKLMPGGFKIF